MSVTVTRGGESYTMPLGALSVYNLSTIYLIKNVKLRLPQHRFEGAETLREPFRGDDGLSKFILSEQDVADVLATGLMVEVEGAPFMLPLDAVEARKKVQYFLDTKKRLLRDLHGVTPLSDDTSAVFNNASAIVASSQQQQPLSIQQQPLSTKETPQTPPAVVVHHAQPPPRVVNDAPTTVSVSVADQAADIVCCCGITVPVGNMCLHKLRCQGALKSSVVRITASNGPTPNGPTSNGPTPNGPTPNLIAPPPVLINKDTAPQQSQGISVHSGAVAQRAAMQPTPQLVPQHSALPKISTVAPTTSAPTPKAFVPLAPTPKASMPLTPVTSTPFSPKAQSTPLQPKQAPLQPKQAPLQPKQAPLPRGKPFASLKTAEQGGDPLRTIPTAATKKSSVVVEPGEDTPYAGTLQRLCSERSTVGDADFARKLQQQLATETNQRWKDSDASLAQRLHDEYKPDTDGDAEMARKMRIGEHPARDRQPRRQPARSDEEIARQLQEQWNAEATSQRSDLTDEQLARQLAHEDWH